MSVRLRRALSIGFAGLALLLFVAVGSLYLARAVGSRSMLPLKAEHRVRFAEEFRADQETDTDWAEYLAIEERLAGQLQKIVEGRVADRDSLDRHASGSVSNPDEHEVNWNRSYVLRAENAKGTAVLLHGLSDSPYSVRATAQLLQSQGITTFAPRMPGHGFAVGDLRFARWQDWMAAARIAMRQADKERDPQQPLILGGYSNGGLLAIRYALDCGKQTDMPCPDGILLMSPAIDVTRFASLGRWHRALSWLGYFEKFQWDTIMPEVDPYKFTSFPKNPSVELYRAARGVNDDLATSGHQLPPILAFQSAVDDTVSTEAVHVLFEHLPANGSELVIYDVNRSNQAVELMLEKPRDLLSEIRESRPLAYDVTLLSNKSLQSREVEATQFAAGSTPASHQDPGLEWPATVFSLSHIAIPFPPNDPVYGSMPAPGALNLGGISPKGERRVLGLTPNYFARLRHNPFYSYQEQKITEWLQQLLFSEDSK